MSVILPRPAWRRWLGEDRAEADELLALPRPYPAEAMRAHPVAARVGNVRNNDPELLAPLAGPGLSASGEMASPLRSSQ